MLPAWVAVTVQVPRASSASAVPLTVQTAGVLDSNATAKLEVAVATSAPGAVPSVWLPGERKVMVCGAGVTEKLTVTGMAAA